MSDGILVEMTQEDLVAFEPEVAVICLGSTEPHGPILPYGTDTWQAEAVCRRAVERANARGGRALLLPPLPIGNNANFKGLPFACRIGVRTLMCVLLDLIGFLEAEGLRKVVLFDGHGGNTDTMRAVLREHVDTTPPGRRAFVCMTRAPAAPEAVDRIEHPSNHGGESETSRMMYLRPELVRDDRLEDLPIGEPAIESAREERYYWVRPWHRHVPRGGGGDTRTSSADKGRDLIETSADRLADVLVDLGAEPWHPEFPYPKRKA